LFWIVAILQWQKHWEGRLWEDLAMCPKKTNVDIWELCVTNDKMCKATKDDDDVLKQKRSTMWWWRACMVNQHIWYTWHEVAWGCGWWWCPNAKEVYGVVMEGMHGESAYMVYMAWSSMGMWMMMMP
jgi:hypothetical protein